MPAALGPEVASSGHFALVRSVSVRPARVGVSRLVGIRAAAGDLIPSGIRHNLLLYRVAGGIASPECSTAKGGVGR
ncbi:hypothetical protein D3C71_1788410 [compost metagenome]